MGSNCLVQITHGGHIHFSYTFHTWIYDAEVCTFCTLMYYKLDIVCITVNHRTAFRDVTWEVNPGSLFHKLAVTGGGMT